jgi:hypothetical protein
MGHSGRCVKITCNFTHPSEQTGNRVYPAKTYIYSYEADDVTTRRAIEKHAKRKYAYENSIRSMWIGFVTTTDQMKFNIRPDSDLKDNIPLVA